MSSNSIYHAANLKWDFNHWQGKRTYIPLFQIAYNSLHILSNFPTNLWNIWVDFYTGRKNGKTHQFGEEKMSNTSILSCAKEI